MRLRIRLAGVVALAASAAAAGPPAAWAQSWPDGPLVVELGGAGRLVVSGDASAVAGERDDLAFFNYTSYRHDVLRQVRLALSARWEPHARFAVVTDVRSENFETPRVYALYGRARPFAAVPLELHAGRVPPVFGRFARNVYAADNPLIGYPLAYQYLTSLRPDAVPAASEDLLRMRGRGWLASYPIGNRTPAPGVPLVSALAYDTGLQARYATGWLNVAAAVSVGTLSSPRTADDNDGRQVSSRAGVTPIPGLVAGVSAARGAWLDDAVPAAGDASRRTQSAFGVDAEYSRDHWLVRGEWMQSRWRLPFIAAPLDARAGFVEARWRVRPRWFVAGRIDRLTFSEIAGETRRDSWDAPVTRVEAGGGWYFRRNLVAKAVVQHNRRDGGRVREKTFVAGQLLFWF
jgi:hypothetical protein